VSTPSDPISISITFAAKWSGDLEIYTVHADGSNLTQLTNNTTDDFAPIWSPDRDKLTFVSGRSGKPGQLYVMKSDGTDQTPLTPDHFAIAPVAWSLDSRYIGFEGVQEGINDFYVADLKNASLMKLTSSEGYFGLGNLTWSSSGNTLAFDVGLDSSGAMRGVILVKLDQPELQKLLPQPSGGYSDFLPEWHPMDDLILLVSTPIPEHSTEQIYIVKPDGSNRQQLTNTDTRKTRAMWSPNGQMIAYGAVQGTYSILDKMIYVLNRDGADQRLVVKGKEVQSDKFSWAADSRHLAFISSETDHPNLYDLYFTDICDNSPHLIARNIANYTPSWRP
jgi:Tol biopolymer transport system component